MQKLFLYVQVLLMIDFECKLSFCIAPSFGYARKSNDFTGFLFYFLSIYLNQLLKDSS